MEKSGRPGQGWSEQAGNHSSPKSAGPRLKLQGSNRICPFLKLQQDDQVRDIIQASDVHFLSVPTGKQGSINSSGPFRSEIRRFQVVGDTQLPEEIPAPVAYIETPQQMKNSIPINLEHRFERQQEQKTTEVIVEQEPESIFMSFSPVYKTIDFVSPVTTPHSRNKLPEIEKPEELAAPAPQSNKEILPEIPQATIPKARSSSSIARSKQLEIREAISVLTGGSEDWPDKIGDYDKVAILAVLDKAAIKGDFTGLESIIRILQSNDVSLPADSRSQMTLVNSQLKAYQALAAPEGQKTGRANPHSQPGTAPPSITPKSFEEMGEHARKSSILSVNPLKNSARDDHRQQGKQLTYKDPLTGRFVSLTTAEQRLIEQEYLKAIQKIPEDYAAYFPKLHVYQQVVMNEVIHTCEIPAKIERINTIFYKQIQQKVDPYQVLLWPEKLEVVRCRIS